MTGIDLLVNKDCISYQARVSSLEALEINRLMAQLKNNWIINDSGHLYKQFTFVDFKSAMRFANQIAVVSEQQSHHPDLTVSWGLCKVEIWTHKLNGLTENDFILAAKIDTIN